MKTKSLILFAILLGLGVSSCTKKVKVDVEEITGTLAGAFKATTGEYEVEKDEDGNDCIMVEIERTNESVPYTAKTVSVFGQNVPEVFTVAGFGYIECDAEGKKTSETKAEDNTDTKDDQLEILKLKKGEKAKLPIVFKDGAPASIKLTSDLKIEDTGEIALNGSIGQYGTKNFTIDLSVIHKRLSGQYQYLTSPAGAYLYLDGRLLNEVVSDGKFIFGVDIQESNDRSDWSGAFDGTLVLQRDSKDSPYYYVLRGSFLSYQLKTYIYDFKSEPITE